MRPAHVRAGHGARLARGGSERGGGLARRAGLALALAISGLLGCEELFEPSGPTPEELEAAQALAVAVHGASTPVSDEPHGESIDACLERLSRETPASVRETIADIGYTELLRDSCRARIAEDERTVEPCAQIEARLVRRACETRVAIAARDPGLCPPGPRGHEPLCLALASRDPRLCQAAPHLEREACSELLGSGEACEQSISPELCRGIVERHRARFGGESELAEVPSATLVEPELIVSFVREASGAPEEPVGEEARLDSLDRGARVLVESGRTLLELADPLGLSVVSHAGRTSVAMRVPLPPADGASDARLDARIGVLGASFEVAHPQLGTLRASEGEVHIAHFARELGGRVEGTFRVRCPSAPGTIRVQGRFRTFVRDLSGPPSEAPDDEPSDLLGDEPALDDL